MHYYPEDHLSTLIVKPMKSITIYSVIILYLGAMLFVYTSKKKEIEITIWVYTVFIIICILGSHYKNTAYQ